MMTLMVVVTLMVASMMADVSSRYHGGDGDDDGRDPGRRRPRVASQCEASGIKKGRGKNANKNLDKAFKANNNRPLPLAYNPAGGTYKIVGENSNMFTRKISTEVEGRADFHYSSWAKVPNSVKDSIYSTLQHYFDLRSLRESADWIQIKAGIDFECKRAYKDRKFKMHKWFKKHGGRNDLETSRSTPYENMNVDKWNAIIDNLWLNEKKIRQSEANIENRGKHRYASCHGSASYAQQLYKMKNAESTPQQEDGPEQEQENATEDIGNDQIRVWYNNHVLKNPDNEAILADWERIRSMRNTMRQNEAYPDGSIDEVECLRRIFGTRRGFQTGVGRTLRYMPPEMEMGSSSSNTSTQTRTEADFQAALDARFREFYDQLRAANPGLNLATTLPSQTNQPSNDDDEDDDSGN